MSCERGLEIKVVGVNLENIEQYPNKPWDWNGISCNPNLTMEFVEKYSNKDWDWKDISSNKF